MAAVAKHRVLRHRDRTPGPWANGGGVTYEIIRSPGAGPDFDWRLSVAEVAAEGPFSYFPGIDRILILLTGTMNLAIDGVAYDVPLHEPLPFAGEAVVESLLPSGPTMDLNVMTRRDRAIADVRMITDTEVTLTPEAGTDRCVVVVHGSWHTEGIDEPLGSWDCVVVDNPLALRGEGTLAIVTVRMRADTL